MLESYSINLSEIRSKNGHFLSKLFKKDSINEALASPPKSKTIPAQTVDTLYVKSQKLKSCSRDHARLFVSNHNKTGKCCIFVPVFVFRLPPISYNFDCQEHLSSKICRNLFELIIESYQ